MFKYLLFFSYLMSASTISLGQSYDAAAIRSMIARYKEDVRGPYKDIKWFCKDGTIREARDPCPGIKAGFQRARYKDDIQRLADNDHIFLGQILATTENDDFWDASNGQSRFKQYQLEKYLRTVDDGWINRKGQYYRGAMQDEDETKWGIDFFNWLLADAGRVQDYFFLIRQSAKDIPHASEDNNIQRVRALSEEIAEVMPSFQEMRVKIHGMPDEDDVNRVREYRTRHQEKISASLNAKFDDLEQGLLVMFRPFQVKDFDAMMRKLPDENEATQALEYFTRIFPTMDCPPEQCQLISKTALILRNNIGKQMGPSARLAFLDISNKLELLYNQEFTRWKIEYLNELLQQVYSLSEAATAFGFLELWEWDHIQPQLEVPMYGTITMEQLGQYTQVSRQVAEWGAGMVRAYYQPVIELFGQFEPLAGGFYDDRVRSSVLLFLGSTVSRLGDEFAIKAGLPNDVLGIKDQSSIRGLNPGFTVGELVVVSGSPDQIELSPDKIYVFHNPPSDLKPVAGIATVTEGNMVSHIQLLARNLGIPNAVVSANNLDALRSYHGKEIFYAVSNKGTVIMKPSNKMSQEERKLFEEKKRSEEKISVPVEKITLHNPKVLDLSDIDASHSGKICGPKAANLGQLKQMFPGNVVEGLVLPFGIFREHMNQTIPGRDISYWAMMIRTFDHAECMKCNNATDAEIEKYILGRLDTLRTLIKSMPLLPEFRRELQEQFQAVLGQPLGRIPVFIRSDTNMEDLKDFTGAGLNLTVFNVLDTDRIFQGIRDVWASPYSERSYKWRQRYLNNPENVFPSILIIPSVNADHSGVMITKGLTNQNDNDVTVAFNLGVGGAVDGQAAETWLLTDSTSQLIAPAREPTYLTIPPTGGSVRRNATFAHRIVAVDDLQALRLMAQKMKKQLPDAPGVNSKGPFDIELGFKDGKIWLFQVRPFVENKQALATEYLQKITPEYDKEETLLLM